MGRKVKTEKRQERRIFKRIILVVSSLICSLAAFEVFFIRFFPQKTYSFLYNNAIACFEKSEVTVFTLKPNCTIPFIDFETEEQFTTRTNSFGYRGEDFEIKKKTGEKRILVEGDSFILGFGVRDKDLLTSHLEQGLKKLSWHHPLSNAKVINAGYAGGFGPDGYYLHLKTEGITLKPDLVVFAVFVYNDFSDIDNNEWIGGGEFGEPVKVVSKTTTVDERGNLIPISTPFVYRILWLRDSHTAIFASNALTDTTRFFQRAYDRIRFKIKAPVMPTGEAKDSSIFGPHTNVCVFGDLCHRRTRHLFDDFLSTVKASKELIDREHSDGRKHLVVLIIPADFQIYPEAQKKHGDSGLPLNAAEIESPNPQRRLEEMFEKENIPYIDLLPAFRNSREKLYDIKDGHWNAKGHEKAADEILKWMEGNYK